MSEKQRSLLRLQSQLQQTQAELEGARATIAAMQTSRFWKLRTKVLKLKSLASRSLKLFTHNPTITSSQQHPLPDISSSVPIPYLPTVLLIVEASLPQCLRYRVQQKIEQLQAINYEVSFIPWTEYELALRQLHFCHIVIFYRVPAFSNVIRAIKYANYLKKITFFDIDDLVFDRDELSEKVDSFKEQLSSSERAGFLEGVVLYRQAMSLCQYAIASTPALAKKMEEVVGHGNSFVHRNAIDAFIHQYLKFTPPKLHRNYVSIFYGSGTKTHDADFELVASALVQILLKHEHVRLTIIGYLNLPAPLAPYVNRIDRINHLSIESYFEFLLQADINIAPLEKGVFADCKSEIKWLEAAVLEVPSIVTGTQTYCEIIEDGVDAFIAHTSQDWFDKLDLLVREPSLRHTIAQNAYAKAQRNYHPSAMAINLQKILTSAIQQSAERGLVSLEENKKKLLFVNVLYPPQVLEAAVSVKNTVNTLVAKHNDYKISVFTCDLQNSNPYELSEYTQDGIHVTALSVAPGPDLDWRYQDTQVHNIFQQYLIFNKPDLIHFHCVQRLTASVLEAAEKLAIPYVVTVHNAWWLCDHQFLIDKKGVECDPRQNDPMIAARYTDDINSALLRRRYLAQRLNHAKALLAVSDFQAKLYRQNGFTQIHVNCNGIRTINEQVSELESIYESILKEKNLLA